MNEKVDFFVRFCGSIIMLIPDTDTAREWVADFINIDEWQNPDQIAIDPRYWDAIAEGIQEATLSYKFI
jgi:hypothetical protein